MRKLQMCRPLGVRKLLMCHPLGMRKLQMCRPLGVRKLQMCHPLGVHGQSIGPRHTAGIHRKVRHRADGMTPGKCPPSALKSQLHACLCMC